MNQAKSGGKPRIGVVGTGPMSRSFAKLITRHQPGLTLSRVLTRRPLDSVDYPADGVLTNSLDDLVDHADVIVECTGDVAHGTQVVERAFEHGLPVVTLDAELHVTTGSYLAGKGVLTEAEGDQPGTLAALHEDALEMGFKPLVYGNMKGFKNLNPSPEDMAYWAEKQGISIPNTTGATDGTKVQIEQALVANWVGATITRTGLEGPASPDLQQAAVELAKKAEELGQPISDYVLAVNWNPTGVFMVCRHDDDLADLLAYFKLGRGPYYLLVKPYHLCSLEIAKAVKRVLAGGRPLLNNTTRPTIGVGAIAKRELAPGELVERGAGGFQVRGEAVRISEHPRHVPVGVIGGACMRRRVEPGQLLTLDDVELPHSRAAEIALDTIQDAARPG